MYPHVYWFEGRRRRAPPSKPAATAPRTVIKNATALRRNQVAAAQKNPVARRALGENDDLTLRMRWNYARTLYKDPGATLDDLREDERARTPRCEFVEARIRTTTLRDAAEGSGRQRCKNAREPRAPRAAGRRSVCAVRPRVHSPTARRSALLRDKCQYHSCPSPLRRLELRGMLGLLRAVFIVICLATGSALSAAAPASRVAQSGAARPERS